jgi:hypothetical protein
MGNKTKRKRGGQPGNQNARRHGFYSGYFDPGQIRDFRKVIKEDRVGIKRFVRAILKNAGTNQLQTKLMKKMANNGTNQAKTPINVPK